MKKILVSTIVIVVILSFAGCRDINKKPATYIEKAQLTEEEENIANLLGSNMGQHIYDFKLDDTVKSVQINTYKLKNGEWKIISGGGGRAFSDKKGRIALDFENLAEGLRIGLQSENSSGSSKYSTDPEEDFLGMSRATSILNDLKEIIYEREIPLVIQISTTKNAISSYDVEYFFTPNEYEKHGYEHVYAITIKFSQKTVGELDSTNLKH